MGDTEVKWMYLKRLVDEATTEDNKTKLNIVLKDIVAILEKAEADGKL